MGTVLVLLCTVQSTWHIPLMLMGLSTLYFTQMATSITSGETLFPFFSFNLVNNCWYCAPERAHHLLQTIV